MFEKYGIGLFCSLFNIDCCNNIECSPIELIDLFANPLFKNLKILIKSFNSKYKKIKALRVFDVY